MRILGAARGQGAVEANADTGAGLELAPEDRLSVEILTGHSTARQGTTSALSTGKPDQAKERGHRRSSHTHTVQHI